MIQGVGGVATRHLEAAWRPHCAATTALRHAIRIIKSAYSALFATAQLSCFELAAVRCLRQYSRESKLKKYQPKNRFRFNSIFKKNLISIFDSIIVTSLLKLFFLEELLLFAHNQYFLEYCFSTGLFNKLYSRELSSEVHVLT